MFTESSPCLGLTFDQGGDRAQTKQTQCRRGEVRGGRGGRSPFFHSRPYLVYLGGGAFFQSLFIYSTLLCSPLSCLLSLYSTLCEIPTHLTQWGLWPLASPTRNVHVSKGAGYKFSLGFRFCKQLNRDARRKGL